MKMKCNFLGGADIVGRMAMTMEVDGKTMLVEYGISPTKPPEYPLPIPGKIDHVFLTHSHLDHCGMIPAVCGKESGRGRRGRKNRNAVRRSCMLYRDGALIS